MRRKRRQRRARVAAAAVGEGSGGGGGGGGRRRAWYAAVAPLPQSAFAHPSPQSKPRPSQWNVTALVSMVPTPSTRNELPPRPVLIAFVVVWKKRLCGRPRAAGSQPSTRAPAVLARLSPAASRALTLLKRISMVARKRHGLSATTIWNLLCWKFELRVSTPAQPRSCFAGSKTGLWLCVAAFVAGALVVGETKPGCAACQPPSPSDRCDGAAPPPARSAARTSGRMSFFARCECCAAGARWYSMVHVADKG